MKIIAGLATLVVGVILVGVGINYGNWLVGGIGAVVTYTGFRVIKA